MLNGDDSAKKCYTTFTGSGSTKKYNKTNTNIFDHKSIDLSKLYDPNTDPKEIERLINYLESKPEWDKNDFERYTIQAIREGRLEEFLNKKPVIEKTPTFLDYLTNYWLKFSHNDPYLVIPALLVVCVILIILFFHVKKKLNYTVKKKLNYIAKIRLNLKILKIKRLNRNNKCKKKLKKLNYIYKKKPRPTKEINVKEINDK